MVATKQAAPSAPVAGDVTYAQLDELRQGWEVMITEKSVTVTSLTSEHAFEYFITDGRLDRAIARAWAGEPPDRRYE